MRPRSRNERCSHASPHGSGAWTSSAGLTTARQKAQGRQRRSQHTTTKSSVSARYRTFFSRAAPGVLHLPRLLDKPSWEKQALLPRRLLRKLPPNSVHRRRHRHCHDNFFSTVDGRNSRTLRDGMGGLCSLLCCLVSPLSLSVAPPAPPISMLIPPVVIQRHPLSGRPSCTKLGIDIGSSSVDGQAPGHAPDQH